MNLQCFSFLSLSTALLLACGVILSGCDRKETIVDIKTPGGQIEVERSLDNGKVDVEIIDK